MSHNVKLRAMSDGWVTVYPRKGEIDAYAERHGDTFTGTRHLLRYKGAFLCSKKPGEDGSADKLWEVKEWKRCEGCLSEARRIYRYLPKAKVMRTLTPLEMFMATANAEAAGFGGPGPKGLGYCDALYGMFPYYKPLWTDAEKQAHAAQAK